MFVFVSKQIDNGLRYSQGCAQATLCLNGGVCRISYFLMTNINVTKSEKAPGLCPDPAPHLRVPPDCSITQGQEVNSESL